MSEFGNLDQMVVKDDYKVALYQAAVEAASLIRDSLKEINTYPDAVKQEKIKLALKLLAIVEGTSLTQSKEE